MPSKTRQASAGNRRPRRKERRNVVAGQAHIKSTFNNTIVSITDPNGAVIASCSSGQVGFKGSRKSTPYAAQLAAENAARAAIRSAQVNVNHARITAPISGYIGRSNVSEGALLTAGGATVLATIQQTNPMYVNVTQSALDVMKMRRQIAEGQMSAVNGAVEVTVILEDGSEYPQKGRLLFTDPTVNETTGQVSLRVEVPNDDNILLPGLYVRVRLPQAQANSAYLIPQRAVTRGAKDTVVVVAADGSMRQQEITIAGQNGNNWIVTGGLKDGDKVAMDGTMIAGMMGAQKVKTQEWQASQPQQSAPAKPNNASAPAAQAASQAK